MFLIVIAAFIGALLSFFCGFGLGTILLPAFASYYALPLAVSATSAVHLANNGFKLFLVGRHAHWPTVWRFGWWSFVGAMLGALLLVFISDGPSLCSYVFLGHSFQVSVIKFVMGAMMISFAIFEWMQSDQAVIVPHGLLPYGGIISGFFGGLSGHQGALRSAFLMRSGLTKEQFLGTRVVVACLVDIPRLAIYGVAFMQSWNGVDKQWLLAAAGFAFLGAWLGNRWVRKMTFQHIQRIVGVALILFGAMLIAGF
ncbi:MAG: TSUP family transporter [Flavobacteriales bacterium]